MPDDYPKLETRSIDQIVADVIDDFPDAITDRNPSALEVKFVEAIGAMYGAMVEALNFWPRQLEFKIFELLGIEPEPATKASVELQFTAVSEDGALVESGTIVKTGSSADAIRFETDITIRAVDFEDDGDGSYVATVEATATEAGADGNVPADTLTTLSEPVSGIDSVTNPERAFGGSDEETISELRERAPIAIRISKYAITHEEFRHHASNMGDVSRAHSIGGQGFVVMHILADDLNEDPSEGLRDAVQEDLISRTIPGVDVPVNQFAIRLVRIPEIEAELEEGADPAEAAEEVQSILEKRISAVDVIDEETTIVEGLGWPWGRSLHLHDIIAWLADVDGLERVVEVYVQWSDDYGETWLPAGDPATLEELEAAADGDPNDEYGLLHLEMDGIDLEVSGMST